MSPSPRRPHPHAVPIHGCPLVLDGGEGGGSAVLWRESQGSLNSSASLDLGFLSSAGTAASPWTEVSPRCASPALPLALLTAPLPSRRAIARAWGAARPRPSPPSTAASTCPTARPRWPPCGPASPSATCWLGYARSEASASPTSRCTWWATSRYGARGGSGQRGWQSGDVARSLLMHRLLQKALVLDQECCVLADQEVKLENRISFE